MGFFIWKMDYKKVYDKIIENRLKNPLTDDEYGERHHIIPRSLGGTDELHNLVKLTAREHFICHALLSEMYEKDSFEWYKMNHAFMMMKSSSDNQSRYFNSRLYELKREDFSIVMSNVQNGKKNSQYGKVWIYNLKLEQSIRIDKSELTDYLNSGWIKGRVLDFKKSKFKHKLLKTPLKDYRWVFDTINLECKKIHKSQIPHYIELGFILGRGFKKIKQKKESTTDVNKEHLKEYYQKIYSDFLSSDYLTVKDFAASLELDLRNLLTKWKLYIENYPHQIQSEKLVLHKKSKVKNSNNGNYGKIYINNGISEYRVDIKDNIPDGYVKGRLKWIWIHHKDTFKNTRILKTEEIPTDYILGRSWKSYKTPS